jgi:predicted SprT family Zn-dependent metalloprotease
MSGQWQPFKQVVDALGQDALQTLLEQGNRNRLHSHACESCGRLRCPCLRMPCEFRPFDKNAKGEWWRCAFCRMVEIVMREETAT